MPPKTSSGSGSTAGSLSERDHQAIVAAFKFNKNNFEIDYEGYAAFLGLANAASGRTNWATLKKKLNISAGESLRTRAFLRSVVQDISLIPSNRREEL